MVHLLQRLTPWAGPASSGNAPDPQPSLHAPPQTAFPAASPSPPPPLFAPSGYDCHSLTPRRPPPETCASTPPAALRPHLPAPPRRILRPYHRRPNGLDGAPAPPPPAPGADGGPEYEVQELLKFKMRWGRPCVLVRLAGCDASRDTWEPLDNLTNCEEAIAAFERASGCALPRRRRLLQPPCLSPLAGITIDATPPGDLRAELVGRTLLFWSRWRPADRWQHGTLVVVQSHASGRAAPSRTWSPTHGRRRRCAAPQTHSLTPPRMADFGSCFSRACSRCRRGPPCSAGPAARDPGPDFPVGPTVARHSWPGALAGPGQDGPGQPRRRLRPFRHISKLPIA